MSRAVDKGLMGEESPVAVSEAAQWLIENGDNVPQPLTRTLREMFGLGFADAVKAMAKAKQMREAHK